MDAIEENGLEADVIYACGPTPMLRALQVYAAEKGAECYLSLGGTNGLRYRRLSCLCVQNKREGFLTAM